MRITRILAATSLILILVLGGWFFSTRVSENRVGQIQSSTKWTAPDTAHIPVSPAGDLIRYGGKLIARTSYYLGPSGKVLHISNAMNCQNCHLEAGSKPFGNNFGKVATTYPTFRPRSGMVESVSFRINDCFQRSMNGLPLDTTSREMKAMKAYILWIGKDVTKKEAPAGVGAMELPFMNRAADTLHGKVIYQNTCRVCHGKNGAGIKKQNSWEFIYPPLWGDQSYNTGAGLFRLSRFAGFARYNMPLGVTWEKPQLTVEEAWDVAAYVNSRPRPRKVFTQDWPDPFLKAADSPDPPFADAYSGQQHKYGPFQPIKNALDSLRNLKR